MKKLDLDFIGKLKRNLQGYKGNLEKIAKGFDIPMVDRRMVFPVPTISSPSIPIGRMPEFELGGIPCPDFSWDTEKSDATIGSEINANVYVIGGSGPYNWVLPVGSNFSLANEQTSGLGNVLTNDGSCDPATIIVKDSCGRQASGIVDVLPFEYDSGNSDAIEESDEITITVLEGVSPFTWVVTGTGFSFAEEETEGRTNILTASGTSCDDAVITITDSCAVEVGDTITLTVDTFEYDPGNPTVIESDNEITITVIGGGGPFLWETDVNGTYFSDAITDGRTNLLTSFACAPGGTGNITVTATCGDPLEVGGGMTAMEGEAGEWAVTHDCGSTDGYTCRYVSYGMNKQYGVYFNVHGPGFSDACPNECANLAIAHSGGSCLTDCVEGTLCLWNWAYTICTPHYYRFIEYTWRCVP